MTKQRQGNSAQFSFTFDDLFKKTTTNVHKRWSPKYIRIISLGDRDISMKCTYEVEDADPIETTNQKEGAHENPGNSI